MARTLEPIYPVFENEVKCIDTYKNFIQGLSYKITAFGTEKREDKKVEVWWVNCTDENEDQEEFTIIKSSMNALIDRKIIVEI